MPERRIFASVNGTWRHRSGKFVPVTNHAQIDYISHRTLTGYSTGLSIYQPIHFLDLICPYPENYVGISSNLDPFPPFSTRQLNYRKTRCSCSINTNIKTVFGASRSHAGVHPFIRKPGPSLRSAERRTLDRRCMESRYVSMRSVMVMLSFGYMSMYVTEAGKGTH